MAQTNTNDPNQSPADFTVDIDSLYNTMIVPIDNMRSLVNINNPQNRSIIQKALNDLSIGSLINELHVEQDSTNYQESRISAFCRMVGFPVVSTNGSFFNPGWSSDSSNINTILQTRLQIISSQGKDANLFFNFRESYYSTIIKENFQDKNYTIKMSVQLLQTAQGFNYLDIFKSVNGFTETYNQYDPSINPNTGNTTPIIYDVQNYKFNIETSNSYANTYNIYADISGNFSDAPSISYHFIYPLITHGVIFLTLQPTVKTVTCPFQTSNKYNSQTTIKRPLLELLIIDRFYIGSGLDNSDVVQILSSESAIQSIDLLSQDSFIANSSDTDITTLYNNITQAKGPYGNDQVVKIYKIIKTIETLIDSLIENQKIVEEIQGEGGFYWVPTCNRGGPEYGISSNPIFYPVGDNAASLISRRDLDILKLSQKDSLKTILSNLNASTTNRDEYAFSQYYNTFAPDQISGFISTVKKSADDEINARKQLLSKGENALRYIEIITGQISGFGLIDFFVATGALNIMQKENLLGFLDDTAYLNLKTNNKDIQLPGTRPTIFYAYSDLETQIQTLYAFAYNAYKEKKGVQ